MSFLGSTDKRMTEIEAKISTLEEKLLTLQNSHLITKKEVKILIGLSALNFLGLVFLAIS